MLKKIMAFREAYLRDENGATAIEYGLIAAAVAVVLIAGLAVFAPELENTLKNVGNAMKGE